MKTSNKRLYLRMYFLVFINSFINFLQLEISTGNGSNIVALKYVLLNVLTISFLELLIILVLRKFWLGNLICGITFSILSLVNYYVIEFRGMPVTVQDIGNIQTALNVSGAYNVNLSLESCLILIITIIIVIISILIRKIEISTDKKSKTLVIGVVFFIISIYIYFGYFSKNPVKPPNVLSLSWTEGYYEYGFMSCSVEILCKSVRPLKKVQGYDPVVVEEIADQYPSSPKKPKNPDIILILNETFYDLNLATNSDSVPDVVDPVRSYDMTHGYACVQVCGGGTSISEYELLTSNSMHLLHGVTPFNSLEFKNSNSIVNYLKACGYYTLGAHPESRVNYSRGRVYPSLGFDLIKFKEDFTDNEYYASRNPENGGMNLITDSSAYKHLINWYEQMPEENPRFCYLLTMQNHSPYDFLEENEQIVHSEGNFGEYDAQVDEYLSCLYKSYEAFAELVEYYKDSERDVIICMVGDHAPVFVLDIFDRNELSAVERDLNLCSTPFLIWSNREFELREYKLFSLIYLVPVLLEEAGIQLSPYYQYMLNMMDKAPVLTQLNHYFDKEYNICPYIENDAYTMDEIKNYFFMEYNNISGKKNRIDKAFLPVEQGNEG